MLDFRDISRQRESLVDQMTSVKHEIKRLLTITFPELEKEKDLFTKSMLRLLCQYPSAERINQASHAEISEINIPGSMGKNTDATVGIIKQTAAMSIGTSSYSKEMIIKQKTAILIHLGKHLDEITTLLIEKCHLMMSEDIALKYVPWKDYKAITADLKRIYQSTTEQEARLELERFAETWAHKYPQISKSWRTLGPNLITLFDFPADIRKVIYTTNAIESLNSVIRKSVKTRKLFPSDDAATKVVYLAIQAASKKWTMPIRNWKVAMNHFMIVFEEQLASHV